MDSVVVRKFSLRNRWHSCPSPLGREDCCHCCRCGAVCSPLSFSGKWS